jgi:6-pyruvoyltetrahydropterin/6-carboxytetrahydropterin synthase
MMPIVYLSRKETFSAAHRLNHPQLSSEANRDLYGKCNAPNGHGHNYTLTITLRGEIDPKTGMLMNVADLKRVIDSEVMSSFDHKNLDIDCPEFKNLPSTAENIAMVIYHKLKDKVPNQLLYEVSIEETPKNTAFYRGE